MAVAAALLDGEDTHTLWHIASFRCRAALPSLSGRGARQLIGL
jgi:hypothetical protein